jgi:hypothetical protein
LAFYFHIFAVVSKDSIGYLAPFLILARPYQILVSKILVCFLPSVSYLFYSVLRGYLAKARGNVVQGGTVVQKHVIWFSLKIQFVPQTERSPCLQQQQPVYALHEYGRYLP